MCLVNSESAVVDRVFQGMGVPHVQGRPLYSSTPKLISEVYLCQQEFVLHIPSVFLTGGQADFKSGDSAIRSSLCVSRAVRLTNPIEKTKQQTSLFQRKSLRNKSNR